MPGLDSMYGVGGQVPQDPETGGGGTPQQSWSTMLADPVARSALLSAGLQMMTGGWGNGTQNLAAAMGAGAQGAAGTAHSLQQEQVRQEESDDKKNQAAAGRNTQLQVAKIGADSRQEVAHIRGEARMEIEKQKLNKVPIAIAIKYRTEARKQVDGTIGNLSLSQAEKDLMIENLASQMYSTDEARGLVGPRPGTPQPGDSGAIPGPGGTTTPGAKTGPESKGGPKPVTPADLKVYMQNPEFKSLAATPEGRTKLQGVNPGLKPYFDLMNGQ